jgi:hypothetical protein
MFRPLPFGEAAFFMYATRFRVPGSGFRIQVPGSGLVSATEPQTRKLTWEP